MYVSELSLTGFRGVATMHLTPDPRINIFYSVERGHPLFNAPPPPRAHARGTHGSPYLFGDGDIAKA